MCGFRKYYCTRQLKRGQHASTTVANSPVLYPHTIHIKYKCSIELVIVDSAVFLKGTLSHRNTAECPGCCGEVFGTQTCTTVRDKRKTETRGVRHKNAWKYYSLLVWDDRE